MKLFIQLFILLLSLGILYPANATEADKAPTITLNISNLPLPDVLVIIEKQSEMSFSYESSVIKDIPKITLQVNQVPLRTCLDMLFRDLSVTYTIKGKFIILRRKSNLVTISGFIRDQYTTEYLIGASVYNPKTQEGTATNNHGFFSLTVQQGDIQLETSYIGYQRFAYHLNDLKKDTVMEILLKSGKELQEIVVTGTNASQNPVYTPQMGTLKISQKTVKSIPTLLGESDVIKTLQTQPGVSAGTEGLAGMYVRGGNGDENLYMIDGIPLYQVNHLGGLFSAFNAEALKDVDFYKSAFPARYGGRLSSVVDVHTKDGNMKEYHGSAMLGLTSGNINFEGPLVKDKTSFNASLRRSWFDVLTAPALAIWNRIEKKDGKKRTGRYAFTDINMKVNHHFNDRSQGYVNLYFGQDFLKGGSTDYKTSDDNLYYESKDIGKLRWGNTVASAGWSYVMNHKMFSNISAYYTRYNSSIRRIEENQTGKKDDEEYKKSKRNTSTENGINDLGFRMNFDYLPAPAHHVRFGSNYIYHHFRPEYTQNEVTGDYEKLEVKDVKETLSANELAVYAEDDWTVNHFIRLNAGIRFSLYNVRQKTYTSLEPRISSRFLINPHLSLKASYARMSQYIHQINESYMSLPTDTWMPVSKKLRPLVSDQVSAGAYYNLHNDYSFSVEGYYKWMNHILDYKDGYNFLPSFIGWEDKLAQGKGWSYGVELIARKETGRVTGWLGYGLMWADRQFAEINDGKRYPAKFDNRHKLNVVANWKLSDKVELTGSWTFMTGNRLTASFENYEDLGQAHFPSDVAPIPPFMNTPGGLEYFTERNNFRLPAYHRLDLGINIYRPKKNGRMGIWNVSIYNVYCHMNAITLKKRFWYNYYCYFETMSILPIIPSVSYTYKF